MQRDAAALNWDKGLEQSCGDRDFLIELVNLLLEDLEQRIPQLQQAVVAKNARRVRELAHAVKGAARNLGAEALGEAAWALEQDPELGMDGLREIAEEGRSLRSALLKE